METPRETSVLDKKKNKGKGREESSNIDQESKQQLPS